MGFEAIKLRLRLLRISVVNTWQADTAYFGDAWGNVLSTVVYTVTSLAFISVIFANVHTLAGYTRDQMLFLIFLIQISFYVIHAWSYNNLGGMVDDVNQGSFDMVLIKPVPALFHTSTRKIGLLSILSDGVPALSILILAINWSRIVITFPHLIMGLVVMIAGQLAFNGLFFLLAVPVFWFGQAANLLNLGYSFMSLNIPYEGVSSFTRALLTTLIPCLIAGNMAASVMLGKSNALTTTAFAILVATLAMLIKISLWKAALRNYTSASS